MYEFQSVTFKNDVFKAKYISKGELYQLTSEEMPSQDFTKAIQQLSPILRRAMLMFSGVPKLNSGERLDGYKVYDWIKFQQERIKAFGIDIKAKENEDGQKVTYTILGVIEVPPTSKSVEIKSIPLSYDPDWYEAEDKEHNKLRKPDDCPAYLTNDDLSAIEEVLHEACEFIDGKRNQQELPLKVATEEDKQELFSLKEKMEQDADSPYGNIIELNDDMEF